MATLQFRKASRKAVPMLISLSGVSGSGKTFSALLLAAGIAGNKGKVGFIDTENGRGEMYCDSPGIVEALPKGYEYARIDPPFSPMAYIGALKAAESAGITVCIVDSGSHEWEGIGGCCDIADSKPIKGEPNWKIAKKPHKHFVNYLLTSNMHIIFCLRAREKVKFMPNPAKAGKIEVVPVGIQPIAEKNFVFEMLVSLRVEEETHRAVPVKVPEPLANLFPKEALITKATGVRIREWNDGGAALGDHEQIAKRAKAAACDGLAAYRKFFKGLTAPQRKHLTDSGAHEENKMDAEHVDEATIAQEGEEV